MSAGPAAWCSASMFPKLAQLEAHFYAPSFQRFKLGLASWSRAGGVRATNSKSVMNFLVLYYHCQSDRGRVSSESPKGGIVSRHVTDLRRSVRAIVFSSTTANRNWESFNKVVIDCVACVQLTSPHGLHPRGLGLIV